MEWWRKVVRFAWSLGRLADGSLHQDILRDNINKAQAT